MTIRIFCPKFKPYYTRLATVEDHPDILAIAKTSKYTKDFGNRLMFSSDAAYEKGWILVAVDILEVIVGFTCVRHKVREPVTMLYFITITPKERDKKIGELLLDDVMRRGPHTCMALNVMKENRAVSFYERLGFKIAGDAFGGEAYRMVKEWEQQP